MCAHFCILWTALHEKKVMSCLYLGIQNFLKLFSVIKEKKKGVTSVINHKRWLT